MNSFSVLAGTFVETTTPIALVARTDTGVKLLIGSNGSLGLNAGTVPCAVAVKSSV